MKSVYCFFFKDVMPAKEVSYKGKAKCSPSTTTLMLRSVGHVDQLRARMLPRLLLEILLNDFKTSLVLLVDKANQK